jgi:hypothetical protein
MLGIGDRNDDLTDYRPEQAHWSQENLPEIIYAFDKPANWLGRADLKDPPLKTYHIYGKFLRDIPILPDHISKDVEGWRMETWSRFDPRIRKHDLVNRMPLAARSDHNTDLSMRAQRFRKDANVLGWVAKGGKFTSERQRLQQLLQGAGVPLNPNTTRGISWGANPYGQPIPVPAKLRWASCVEAAPAQVPLTPAVPAVVNTLLAPPLAAIRLAPGRTIIPAAIAPELAPPSLVVTNTILAIHVTNLPVTRGPNAQRTLLLAAPNIAPSSERPHSLSSTSGRPRVSAINSLSPNLISVQLLDPQLFYPPGQSSTTSTMNRPSQPNQAAPIVNFRPSVAMSTTSPTLEQLLSASTPNCQPTRPSLAGAQNATRHTTSSVKGAAGTSSTNTRSAANSLKRNGENDDQVSNIAYTGESSQRPHKKPRRSTLAGAAVNDGSPGGSFRKRWPRTAFKGAGAGMPQSPNEWLQEANVSQVASEAGLVNDRLIQPARPSLGYHDLYIYHQERNGGVVAAPEDFLHCNGVDAGRVARLGVNVGAYMPVAEAEVLSSDYPQFGDYAHLDAMLDAHPVSFTVRSVLWYSGQLDEGESTIL